jgi:hypothetical protein
VLRGGAIDLQERKREQNVVQKTHMGLTVLALTALAVCGADAPPLSWICPPGFNADSRQLGLPSLTGVTHRLLYDPAPSAADLTGQYESLRHGTYNHHQVFVRHNNRLIVVWTNHMQDENGPGQRLLAKAGRIAPDESDIEWGGDESLSELCPPAHPVRRRRSVDDAPVIDGIFGGGGLDVLEDGRMFVTIRLKVCDGWTDDLQYHLGGGLTGPMPDEHYRPGRDTGPVRERRFRWDLYWHIGRFVQQVELDPAGRFKAVGPMYRVDKSDLTELRITPTITKRIAPLNEPFRSAPDFEQAPDDVKTGYSRGRRVPPCGRSPRYAAGTFKLAANGRNGLAHNTEFRRPDGKWVVVRDNLLDTETYYAAVKNNQDDCYPPAHKTALFGTAMPVAGELPSGAVWLIGSNARRTETYLALSKDGVLFDKTWSLLSLNHQATPGICKGDGGAQYFQAATVGPNIWIVYSIAKEQVGMTKIPVALLDAPLESERWREGSLTPENKEGGS